MAWGRWAAGLLGSLRLLWTDAQTEPILWGEPGSVGGVSGRSSRRSSLVGLGEGGNSLAYRCSVWWTVAVAAVFLAGGPARGQVREGSGDEDTAQAVFREGAAAEVSVHTTAEDVLRALQKRRPPNEVIEPASVITRGGMPVRQPLWPEGAAMVNRSGRLMKDGDWWTFVPDDGDEGALKLLPDATLEGMVRSTVGATSPLHFVVSGEFTVFKGENYLLPRFATRLRAPVGDSSSASAPEGQPPGRGAIAAAPEEPTESVATDAPVDDVLERLRRLQPARTVVTVDDDSAGDTAKARHSTTPGGAPLVDRPGRLIAAGDWWSFVFESDHPDYPEPPVKLLPNRNVELMVEVSDRGTTGLVFIVSGEVTAFKGESYLLPRAARRRIDSGNLRK